MKTGFDKAFNWIKASDTANDALLVYQYRGKTTGLRNDGTPTPEPKIQGNLPGKDYVVVSMVRRKSDSFFEEDLAAIEGAVYLVKCTQLVFKGGQLSSGTLGKIFDPKNPATEATSADVYPEAVIAFSAEFHMLPAKTKSYFDGPFSAKFKNFRNPVFTRNLAVRR